MLKMILLLSTSLIWVTPSLSVGMFFCFFSLTILPFITCGCSQSTSPFISPLAPTKPICERLRGKSGLRVLFSSRELSKRISKLSELLSCSAKASTSKTEPLKWEISVSFSGSDYSPAGMVSIRGILSGCRQSCSILAAVLSAVRLSVRTPKNTICLYFLNSLSRNLYTERFL